MISFLNVKAFSLICLETSTTMDIIQVPNAALSTQMIVAGEIYFVNYQDKGSPFRSRVMFNSCAFSFVQNGQKNIYRAGENSSITKGYGMLIPKGNSIIAEHSPNAEPYVSIIVFFPQHIGKAFVLKHHQKGTAQIHHPSYIHFKTNGYIEEYIRNVKGLIDSRQALSAELATLKVHELLTAIYDMAPELLASIFDTQSNVSLKTIVENNLFNNLSLDELAFLSNRSLSSFKRDFEKTYGMAPQGYIRNRKLEIACEELRKGKSANDLYLEHGYENPSNFSTSFKRKFGVTPAAFQKNK